MAIVFDKLHETLKRRGTTLYKLKAEGKIGGMTLDVLFGRAKGNVSVNTIDKLCEALDCQPADIMTYVKADSVKSD